MFDKKFRNNNFSTAGTTSCLSRSLFQIHDTGSYLRAHVLLNLLNKLGKRDKIQGLPSILSVFRSEFNKFNKLLA